MDKSVYDIPNFYEKYVESIKATEKDYSKMTNEELLEELKRSEIFDKLVFPNEWYSKYELPEKKCQNMKEFLAESAWLKKSSHFYVGKQEIPAKAGGNRPVLEAPEVNAITMLQNSFSDAINQNDSSNLVETH